MSDFTSNFREGNPEDLINPKNGRTDARKGKLLAIVPYDNIVEASQKAAVVRILGFSTKEEHRFITIRRHYVYDPSLPFQNKKKYVYCLGEGCPLCAVGHKANDSHAFIVEHYNHIEKDNGKESVVPTRKILLVGQTVAKQLYIKHMQGDPLSTQVLSISALKGVPSPTYMLDTKGRPHPDIQVVINEIENFNLLKPNQNDIDDARRLAPIQGGDKQGQTLYGSYQPKGDNLYNPSDSQYQPKKEEAFVTNTQKGYNPSEPQYQPKSGNPYTQYTKEEPAQVLPDPWASQPVSGGISFEPHAMPDYTETDIPF